MHVICVFVCVCSVQYVGWGATHKRSKPCYYFRLHSLQGPHGRHHHGMALEDDDKYMCLGWWHWQWYLKAFNHQQHMHRNFTAFIYYIVICHIYMCVYVTVVYVCAYDVYELWYACRITVQVTNYVWIWYGKTVFIYELECACCWICCFLWCLLSNFFFLRYVDIPVVYHRKWFFNYKNIIKL